MTLLEYFAWPMPRDPGLWERVKVKQYLKKQIFERKMKRNFVNSKLLFPGLVSWETLTNYGKNTLMLMYNYKLEELLQHPNLILS